MDETLNQPDNELNLENEIDLPITVDESKEGLAKMLGLSDTPEEENVESDPDSTMNQDDSEAEETPEELPPIEERFKEVEKAYEEPEVDEADPEVSLKQLETNIANFEQQHQNAHFLNGLPDLKFKGESIYKLSEDDFDLYLQDLKDQGKESLATNAAIARNKAVEQAKDWLQREQQLTQAREQYTEAKNRVEWYKVEKDWLKDLPELKDHLQAIDKEISKKAELDPRFAAELLTFNGKMKAVYSVVRDLKLMEQIAKNQPKAKVITPSAPDTKTVSKKVTQNTKTGNATDKIERAKSMSQTEFNTLSDKDLDALLGATLS